LATLLLVVSIIALVVIAGGDDESLKTKETAQVPPPQGGSPGTLAPPAAPGKELKLLGGRLVVAPRPGWEALESSDETATVRLALREPGRDLLATLVIVTVPGAGSLDTTLKVDGGTPFEVPAPGGPVRATAAPGASARVVAGTVRPKGTFVLSLSLTAVDGKDIDAATLRKIFTEQVVPALKFS